MQIVQYLFISKVHIFWESHRIYELYQAALMTFYFELSLYLKAKYYIYNIFGQLVASQK